MKIASEEIIPEQMIPQIDIDAILDLKEINQKFVNDLKKMSPFGPDNQKPIFCSLGVRTTAPVSSWVRNWSISSWN